MVDLNIKNIICQDELMFIHTKNGKLCVTDICDENIKIPECILGADKNVDKIIGGGNHLIIKMNNKFMGMGSNYYGQLGLGHNENIHSPVPIPNSDDILHITCGEIHTLFYKLNGDLVACGDNQYGQLCLNNNIQVDTTILLMNDTEIISINGKKVKRRWSTNIYQYLSPYTQKQIKAFIMVKHIYKKLYGVHIVPYMRDYIINLFF